MPQDMASVLRGSQVPSTDILGPQESPLLDNNKGAKQKTSPMG